MKNYSSNTTNTNENTIDTPCIDLLGRIAQMKKEDPRFEAFLERICNEENKVPQLSSYKKIGKPMNRTILLDGNMPCNDQQDKQQRS